MTELTTYTDNQLLDLASKGNEQAFLEFFNRRADGIFTVVHRIVKDMEVSRDIVQDAFISAWTRRDHVSTMEKPALWLLKTATNLGLKYLRRQKLEQAWLAELRNNSAGTISPVEAGKEASQLIAEAVNLLPAQRRKIYELSREHGLDRKKIAQHLGISEHTVKNQLGAALRSIQQHLIKNGISLVMVISLSKLFLGADSTMSVLTDCI